MTNEELTKKVIEIDERSIQNRENIKTCFDQINEVRNLTTSVHKIATSLEVLTKSQESTEKKVDGLTKDIEEIKEKPAKNWENTVRMVFELVLAAVVGFVLIKLGLQ